MALPDAPVNARLVRPDGSEIPLELAYVRRDPEGVDEWRATTTVRCRAENLRLAIDQMPPHSRIIFPWRPS